MKKMPHRSALVQLSRRSLLCAPAVFAFANRSQADVYPSRQVGLVVPYAAGGTADILARLMAEEFHGKFQKSFIVENKGGAGGTMTVAMWSPMHRRMETPFCSPRADH